VRNLALKEVTSVSSDASIRINKDDDLHLRTKWWEVCQVGLQVSPHREGVTEGTAVVPFVMKRGDATHYRCEKQAVGYWHTGVLRSLPAPWSARTICCSHSFHMILQLRRLLLPWTKLSLHWWSTFLHNTIVLLRMPFSWRHAID
jgi:hypothetical protein